MNLKTFALNLLLSAGCLALSLGLTSCGPKGVSDQTLATDIQAKLYADSTARSANVKVAVNNGIVTLTGDAPTPDVALQVVNIANTTSGIKSVDNQLKISAAAAAQVPPPSTAPATPMTASAPPPPQNMQPPPPVDDTKAMEKERAERARERREARAENAPPPKPIVVTIPAGTDIAVRMIDGISSKTNEAGQTFRASLDQPIVVDGQTLVPTGAPVTVLLDAAKGAGRIKGSSELEVRATSLQYHGKAYNIDTNVQEQVGKGRGKQTAIRSGVGAAAGAVIGAIAGGGKGAAIGTLAGGGAGAGFQLATHGQQVTIPSETQLTFRLQAPVTL